MTIICNNCGKNGHNFQQCKTPITSYGIIAYRTSPTDDGQREYLMICRKDSFNYIDFIRGKYSLHDIGKLKIMLDEMTVTEKQRLVQTEHFSDLWAGLWSGRNINDRIHLKNEEMTLKTRFNTLRAGFNGWAETETTTLAHLVAESTTSWDMPEWEFPKGRRNAREKDIECAIREFEEETGIPRTQLKWVDNVVPFEENFIGSNNKTYKHKYFLANYVGPNETVEEMCSRIQLAEVSHIAWKTYSDGMKLIRPYCYEKLHLLSCVHHTLETCHLLEE